jgi:hypothetical protein
MFRRLDCSRAVGLGHSVTLLDTYGPAHSRGVMATGREKCDLTFRTEPATFWAQDWVQLEKEKWLRISCK